MSDTYFLWKNCPWCHKRNDNLSWHSGFQNVFTCDFCGEDFTLVIAFKAVKFAPNKIKDSKESNDG